MTISFSSSSAYIFECCCGERFNNVRAASTCKKCRSYSVWGYTKYVVDTTTGEVVHGEMPSDEEHAEAAAAAEKRWAAEHAEFQQWLDAQDAEYEAQRREQEAAAAKAAVEDDEDRLWDIQEKLMS